MNLVQLKLVSEVVRSGLNISKAAQIARISQPAASKQIKLLEDELQVKVFVRDRNRLIGLTPVGYDIVRLADVIVESLRRLQDIAAAQTGQQEQRLALAVTHTQARYVLPDIIRQFKAIHGKLQVSLRQAPPREIPAMVYSGEVDMGVVTERPQDRDLVALLCRSYNRVVMVPQGHELIGRQPLTLADIAAFPLIAYEQGYTGYAAVESAFSKAGLHFNVALRASDADVIMNCVGMGLGVAVLSEVTATDSRLAALPAGHLFDPAESYLLLQRRRYLQKHEYDFIKLFNEKWSRAAVQEAMLSTA